MADPDEIEKMNPSIRVVREGRSDVRCMFCNQWAINNLEWGPLCQLEDVTVHYFCFLFSSALPQRGKDSEGIMGFLLEDLRNERKRGAKLRCKYCKLTGATIGCCAPHLTPPMKCGTSFHFTCGIRHGILAEFTGNFPAFCPKHRVAPAPRALEIIKAGWECEICFSDVLLTEEFVWPPCCKRRVFHRTCIQNQARTSGYHFACPACKDKDEFILAMMKSGVFVPNEDALWERNRQFDDLTQGYSHCDAPVCYCPDGRNYDANNKHPYNRNWKIVRCYTCAGAAVHYCCAQLKKMQWKCADCITVLSRDSSEYRTVALIPAHNLSISSSVDLNDSLMEAGPQVLEEYDQIGQDIAHRRNSVSASDPFNQPSANMAVPPVLRSPNEDLRRNPVDPPMRPPVESKSKKTQKAQQQRRKVQDPRTKKWYIVEDFSDDDDEDDNVSINLLQPVLPLTSDLRRQPVQIPELQPNRLLNSSNETTASTESMTSTSTRSIKPPSPNPSISSATTDFINDNQTTAAPVDSATLLANLVRESETPQTPVPPSIQIDSDDDASSPEIIPISPEPVRPFHRGPIRIFWPRRRIFPAAEVQSDSDSDLEILHEKLSAVNPDRVVLSEALKEAIKLNFKQRNNPVSDRVIDCVTLSDDDNEPVSSSHEVSKVSKQSPDTSVVILDASLADSNQTSERRNLRKNPKPKKGLLTAARLDVPAQPQLKRSRTTITFNRS